ncbi:tumor necrosis factor receptor superfamily member 1B [Dunckerocampus dactyliophorus]|uniref:tumor necrosis factor receptor superfamily member 1B n=1 Tax=Dunckerocampus dactyliophorus TaxID=161453 RepID=UPI002407258C|nr:tumor necrosis factor receptor superfamily member 1B [Dunckerocampus dactyliophorus]
MKDVFVLLAAHVVEVLSLPYYAGPSRKCNYPDREYLLEALSLCCSKCPPGRRLTRECNETTESVCEPCERDQYMESWNYAPNCFPCSKCKAQKGLQFAHACSSTAMSKCACRPGMYCIMESDEQHCTECIHHTSCKAGYGVFVPGTATSNVKCKKCNDGTFSDVSSAVEPCRPHTSCHGRPVLTEGTSTSDTVCEADLRPRIQTSGNANQTVTARSPGSVLPSPKSPGADKELVATVASVVGVVIIFIVIAIILLVLYRTIWMKGTARLQPKNNANENCESDDEVNQGHLGETLLTAVASLEQHCLLQKVEVSGDSGHCSSSDTSSQESTEPLQSTVALHQSAVLQTPIQPTQPPWLQNPVTASPHVNVNITFNIGSGDSHYMPSARFIQRHSELRLGDEEEDMKSFNIPQQEEGKELSEQESADENA